MVETPVLFITFCRPEYARLTWEGIKSARPKILYFYSNKGRAQIEGEIERNNEIRSYIKEIDWECNLHTWFREETVNVYDSIRGAIDWLFDNEEQGIVLEEDCVPTKAFFSFCDQMIVRYNNELRVWCISGDCYLDNQIIREDYYFSHYHYMYGWASWASRWKCIDINTRLDKSIIRSMPLKRLYKTNVQVRHRIHELNRIADFVNRTKCWDYYLGYVMDSNGFVSVHPKYHLVTNVGLSGVHHSSEDRSLVNKIADCKSEIYLINKHPDRIEPDLILDYETYRLLQYIPFGERVKGCLQYRIPLFIGVVKSAFRRFIIHD